MGLPERPADFVLNKLLELYRVARPNIFTFHITSLIQSENARIMQFHSHRQDGSACFRCVNEWWMDGWVTSLMDRVRGDVMDRSTGDMLGDGHSF